MCASSTNIIVLPFFLRPASTSLKRSSKSPRYLLPASIAPMSRLKTSYSLRNSGTLPCTMLNAIPSAIAVLPTPGSPTSNTLFLLRRPNASAMLSSSSDLPITGSIRSRFTSSFKFVVKLFNAFNAALDISSSSIISSTSLLIYSPN